MALSSPRPWRCFRSPFCLRQGADVFSTSVEVFPELGWSQCADPSLLHVRGGVSGTAQLGRPKRRSSPRPWRCFPEFYGVGYSGGVFSTSVEVFPPRSSAGSTRRGLLHVRGGVSLPRSLAIVCSASSPRPWRCFRFSRGLKTAIFVFSTSVEVFLKSSSSENFCSGLLHVRGGVSEAGLSVIPSHVSSPRPWRCFRRPGGLRRYGYVFSTSVEVFSIEKLAGR